MDSDALLLKAQGLTFRYSKNEPPAVEGASISVFAGKVYAILGANGTGKSTFLRLLLGFLRPERGRVEVYARKPTQSARLVSFVPQREQTPFAFRVAEYMLLGRTPHLGFLASPKAEDERIVRLALERLGILHLAHKPITALSGGEHQLVLIGRALVQEAPIMLLDEPATHLDLGNRYRVLLLLRSLARDGRAIVFTTHDPQSAAAVADYVLLMQNGHIIVNAPTREALTEANLSALYGINLKVATLDGATVVLPRI